MAHFEHHAGLPRRRGLRARVQGAIGRTLTRVWKAELQKFATETGLTITVVHFPPGTSKWNKVEHRLFSHITMNWRGRPLEDYETVVKLIGATKTTTGLHVRARLDRRTYNLGVKVPDKLMANLNLERADFHGEWNYKHARRRSRNFNSSPNWSHRAREGTR